MNYDEALNKLTSKSFFSKFSGLYRMKKTMEHFGNPEERLSIIHVAGTNGKGSVCAMLHSVLMEAGYKVGLFTSPYIHDFRERIQINGKKIPKASLTEIAEKVFEYTDRLYDTPNQFELLTIIALLYFERQGCDVVILETGLGGTFDPTNIVPHPLCSVIMNIGLDHCAILGNTIEEIAAAKAGIIKNGHDVVIYPSCKEAVDVLTSTAFKKNAIPHFVDLDCLKQLDYISQYEHFRYRNYDIRLNLLGKHQQKNCAVAIEVIRLLNKGQFFISDQDITKGLSHVNWPVRMELLHNGPDLYLDGGHNPQCIMAAWEFFKGPAFFGRKIHVVTGMLSDKDYKSMISILKNFAEDIRFYRFENARAISNDDVHALCDEYGLILIDNLEDTILQLVESVNSDEVILCIGSLYMTDRIRSLFKEEQNDEEQ